MNARLTSLLLAPIALLSAHGYGLTFNPDGTIQGAYADAPSGTYNNVIFYFICPIYDANMNKNGDGTWNFTSAQRTGPQLYSWTTSMPREFYVPGNLCSVPGYWSNNHPWATTDGQSGNGKAPCQYTNAPGPGCPPLANYVNQPITPTVSGQYPVWSLGNSPGWAMCGSSNTGTAYPCPQIIRDHYQQGN